MKGWLTQDLPCGVVVSPIDDIVLHTCTAECVCAPRVETQGTTCRCSGWPGKLAVRRVIVHQAMDGRA